MLVTPQRKLFASREDFAAAVQASFAELWGLYEAASVLSKEPRWTKSGRGTKVFNVSLPMAIAMEGAFPHALSSALKQIIERGKSIKRIARVEADGQWTVWIETD